MEFWRRTSSSATPGVPARWRTLDLDISTAPLRPVEFRKGDLALCYFSALTSLGTPHDITLQELRIEAFFPADEATEHASRRLAAG
jgi:MmyB-like transcription regulator ligand binding domain